MVNFGPYDDLELSDTSPDLGMVAGPSHTAMKCASRLRTYQGEWWLDPAYGIPYHQSILGQKTPDLVAIRGIFIAALKAVPGVQTVTRLETSFDNATRKYTVAFSVLDESGTLTEDMVTL